MQGTVQNTRNTTLIFPIYLLNINICYKKPNIYFIQTIRSTVSTQDLKTNLHPPTANLKKFQKGVYYSPIKIIFNNLPHKIKDSANDILPFQNALKRFLLANSFYNSKEYFN